jgi:serine/threonine protein kinase
VVDDLIGFSLMCSCWQHVESPQHVVLVFELMEGGDLFHYLLDRQIEAVKASTECISSFQYALPEDEARHVFNQVSRQDQLFIVDKSLCLFICR